MNILDDDVNILISTRLKELRTDHRLSHEKLHEELKKVGIKISVQALKDYEVDYVEHSKFSSTKGMKIETLYNLAQFYNVSVEWILGLTDIKNPIAIIRNISEYTGLNDSVIANLFQDRDHEEISVSRVINFFYEHGGLTKYAEDIDNYKSLYSEYLIYIKMLEALLQRKGIDNAVNDDFIYHHLFDDDNEISGICRSIADKNRELEFSRFTIQQGVMYALRIYEERLEKNIKEKSEKT